MTALDRFLSLEPISRYLLVYALVADKVMDGEDIGTFLFTICNEHVMTQMVLYRNLTFVSVSTFIWLSPQLWLILVIAYKFHDMFAFFLSVADLGCVAAGRWIVKEVMNTGSTSLATPSVPLVHMIYSMDAYYYQRGDKLSGWFSALAVYISTLFWPTVWILKKGYYFILNFRKITYYTGTDGRWGMDSIATTLSNYNIHIQHPLPVPNCLLPSVISMWRKHEREDLSDSSIRCDMSNFGNKAKTITGLSNTDDTAHVYIPLQTKLEVYIHIIYISTCTLPRSEIMWLAPYKNVLATR
ncbi:hypothetical protein ACJX0J_021641 [Zea mays]